MVSVKRGDVERAKGLGAQGRRASITVGDLNACAASETNKSRPDSVDILAAAHLCNKEATCRVLQATHRRSNSISVTGQ